MPWPLLKCPGRSSHAPAAVNVPRPFFKCHSGCYSGTALATVRYFSAFMLKDLYNTVKDAVLSSTNATSLKQALEDLNIPKRTFNRKRPIAELYLLDHQAFERARDDIAAASKGRRINQEKLAKQCSDILKTRDMQVRRRVAVTQGLLIWLV